MSRARWSSRLLSAGAIAYVRKGTSGEQIAGTLAKALLYVEA